ncbi:DUF2079 domain-containing protein [Rhizohabitans arisaemae]|uniref:DUF2079 domain-containing protein n=1 Tax=Rhizohabitans arisaemae TaxID=2720610 RepID=UPI0024B24E22|nr:DUF2079 domain-containing protein [Rhizohabitans arisaemae]
MTVSALQPPASIGVRPGGHRRHVIALAVICTVAASCYALLSLVKFGLHRASVFDLVIFDQAVRGWSGFGLPYSPAVGVNKFGVVDFLQLADHFSPILALLAPLYWIHDGPATLLVAQAVLFTLAVPWIWRYTRRRMGTAPAYLVSVAYLISWPVAQAVNFDFHEVAFVPVLTAIMIERFDAGRILPGSLAAFGLLLVKEDMGLLVSGFGLYLLVTRRWAVGAAFVAGGLSAMALTRNVLIPAAGGDSAYFWAYNHLGPDVASAALHVLGDPIGTLALLFSHGAKIGTIGLLLWPVLFACLASPLIVPAIPLVLERLLSDRVLWWQADFQYNAFVIVIVMLAAVDGVTRITRWIALATHREPEADDPAEDTPDGPAPAPDPRDQVRARVIGTSWAACVLTVSVTLLPNFAFKQLVDPAFYRSTPRTAAAEEAISKVPDGVTVEAVNHLGPALSARTTVLLWDNTPRNAPWVVADTLQWAYPFASADRQREQIDTLLQSGYKIVYDRDGFLVLNRG